MNKSQYACGLFTQAESIPLAEYVPLFGINLANVRACGSPATCLKNAVGPLVETSILEKFLAFCAWVTTSRLLFGHFGPSVEQP